MEPLFIKRDEVCTSRFTLSQDLETARPEPVEGHACGPVVDPFRQADDHTWNRGHLRPARPRVSLCPADEGRNTHPPLQGGTAPLVSGGQAKGVRSRYPQRPGQRRDNGVECVVAEHARLG